MVVKFWDGCDAFKEIEQSEMLIGRVDGIGV